MNFIEQHYEYIHATANANAVQIARATGLWTDVDDLRQDLITALIAKTPKYDERKSKPTTFISMCLNSAKKDLLAALYADKRRVAMRTHTLTRETVLKTSQATTAPFPEAIAALPAWHATVCREILSGRSVAEVARARGVTPRRILCAIFDEVPDLIAKAANPARPPPPPL